MPMKIDGCVLCDDYLARHFSYYKKVNNLYEKEIVDEDYAILHETTNFYVIPDLSPLANGHVLIVTKKHCQSMAYFEKEMVDELASVTRYVDTLLKKAYNTSIVHFEHGSAHSSSYSLRSINHFHLHCVPLRFSLIDKLKTYDLGEMVSVDDYYCLKRYAHSDYLFIQEGDTNNVLLIEKEMIVSQLLRKIIYGHDTSRVFCSLPNYDWKLGIDYNSYFKSKNELINIFRGEDN